MQDNSDETDERDGKWTARLNAAGWGAWVFFVILGIGVVATTCLGALGAELAVRAAGFGRVAIAIGQLAWCLGFGYLLAWAARSGPRA